MDVAVASDGTLYVADLDNCRIRQIDAASPTMGPHRHRRVRTLAGSGEAAVRDGVGAAASIFAPAGLHLDEARSFRHNPRNGMWWAFRMLRFYGATSYDEQKVA